ncbi:Essential protein Yae1, N terminal [Teratosphaeriaceae sp. CCFEE 6253]|nr:Essential protein Yae1, N terminal [Teratosphaeriaceae sp. CCFEE 6253]
MLRDLPSSAREEVDLVLMTSTLGTEEERPTYVDPFDDVFGSAPASPVPGGHDNGDGDGPDPRRRDAGASFTPHHSDISRLRSTHVTNGYREGIAASKELHMQDGFDEGYTLGAELGLKAGWCLGAVEGMRRAVAPGGGEADVSHGPLRAEVGALSALHSSAVRDLEISRLCGREYFGEDGLWLYDVPGPLDGEHELTFERVAAAHPLLRQWRSKVLQVAEQLGLQLVKD